MATKLGLVTARLHLRPCARNDLEALHRLWTLPDVRLFLWDNREISRSSAEQVIESSLVSFERSGYGLWIIRRLDQPAIIGFAGLRRLPADGDPELLYGLDPDHWRKGFATEGARAVLRFGFEPAGLERIRAATDVPNTRSVAVLERLGMNFEKREMANGFELVRYVLARMDFRPERTLYRASGIGFKLEEGTS